MERVWKAYDLYLTYQPDQPKPTNSENFQLLFLFRFGWNLVQGLGQIQQQGWKLISIWKSRSFTPDPPRFALFICIIIFIHCHSRYSWHLIRKSRYQSLKNIFFGHSCVHFRSYFPCLLDVTRRFFRAPVIPRAHNFFFLRQTIIVHSQFMDA